MCGIVFLQGPNARERLAVCLERIAHRGPDDRSVWCQGDVALGFARLAINGDLASGRQPYRAGPYVGAVNGEIYNHRALTHSFGLPDVECDTHVVLPLLDRLGAQVIDDLDGFYAALAYEPATRQLISLRDHMGKKPLFVGRSGEEIFVTSELKALDVIDWFEPLPRGGARIDLDTGCVTRCAEHRPVPASGGIVDLFEDAVRKRMPQVEQPVAVFLSGGLDSSLVAAMAARQRDDVVYYTLGDADGSDRRAVTTVAQALNLGDLRVIAVPQPAQMAGLLRSLVRATESYNPSIVSNGLATWLLARAAHADGIKVVLTGEGADELFGGYHTFEPADPWREIRAQLIDDMHLTELRRLDLSCMAHGVEARCPFLDRAVRAFSERLGHADMYGGGANKITLRRSFEGVLPAEVLWRPKTSFDVGSGVRGRVVQALSHAGQSEREALRAIWGAQFSFDPDASYFHRYPVFDVAIDRRGAIHR